MSENSFNVVDAGIEARNSVSETRWCSISILAKSGKLEKVSRNSVLDINSCQFWQELAAGPGFEPGLPDPESGVLPLDNPAKYPRYAQDLITQIFKDDYTDKAIEILML